MIINVQLGVLDWEARFPAHCTYASQVRNELTPGSNQYFGKSTEAPLLLPIYLRYFNNHFLHGAVSLRE